MKTTLTALLALGLISSANAKSQDGEAVYLKACKTCHEIGVAGAPKTGDAEAWQPLLGKGMDELVASVKQGKGAMPPGGMCLDCTDEDLKAAIEYMAK